MGRWQGPGGRGLSRDHRRVQASDGLGHVIARSEQEAFGPASCVAIGDSEPHATGYRVVEIRARLIGPAGHEGNHLTTAARVHLRWRDADERFALVGLERDE
mgnify:CR=1 FL=1